MQASGVSVRYARALLELGQETRATAQYLEELGRFVGAYEGSAELRQALANPSVTLAERKALVRVLAGALSLGKTVEHFVLLLLDKDRAGVLPEIFVAYQKMADEQAGSVRASVTSAAALEAGQLERMRQSLARLTGKNVIVEAKVDPSLLGGAVTRLGGKVYDGSLKTQLERLRQRVLSA